MGQGRFSSFTLAVGESDLYVGFRGAVSSQALQQCTLRLLRRLRQEILDYSDPRLLTSLVPLYQSDEHSPLIESMLSSAERANVGPMAAVAGAIAQQVGLYLLEHHALSELVIENGGDLFVHLTEPLSVSLYAPPSPFSGALSIVVNGQKGIATSSATMGHSLSFGRADAVMVVADDAALADAMATGYCNRVQNGKDAEPMCTALCNEEGVVGAIIAIGDIIAIGGELEVQRL